MTDFKRHNRCIRRLTFVVLFAICGTGMLIFLDAYDWFARYRHLHEIYDFGEIVGLLLHLILLGMLWWVVHLYKKANHDLAYRSNGIGGHEKIPTEPPFFPQQAALFEFLQKLGLPIPNFYRSPFLLLISLAMVIAVAETTAMIVLQFLPPMSVYTEALVDVAFLLIIISPALYFIFFRSLVRQIIIRGKAEEALSQLNHELEHQVERRTAQLQAELTQRKLAEVRLVGYQEHLRGLSLQLSLVEERERHRIATELHDNIGHSLAMVNNQLGLLESSIPKDREELLHSIERLVKESIRYTRTLTAEISPPWIYALSFASALKGLAEDILKSQGIEVHLKANADSHHLAEGERVFLLKAVQELLVNIVKHAKAQVVRITLHTEGNDVIVSIVDDGIGFDIDTLPPISSTYRQGFGIFIIQERLAHLNGSFAIKSKPGHGTAVTLKVPTLRNS